MSYRRSRKDLDYNNSTLYVSNTTGDYTADQSLYRFTQEYKQWQALVEGEARTGAIAHKLTYYERNPITPTVALLYKPTSNDTLYVSYVEALERRGKAGMNTINVGEVMSPVKSKQYEAGYKYETPIWSATWISTATTTSIATSI